MDRFFLLVGLCCCLATSSAQSLITQLGGAPTDFTILVNHDSVEVVDQYIIKRAVSDYKFDGDGGYGYGYESFHFEFSLDAVRLNLEARERRLGYRISFLDENGKVLGFITEKVGDLLGFSKSDADRIKCYNFELKNVPLTILQHCRTIHLLSI